MKTLVSFFIAFICLACNEEEQRYEKIDKLRALGVETTPVAAVPSTDEKPVVTTLKFYLASPSQDEITVTNFVDPAAGNAFFAELTPANTTPVVTELNGLYLHQLTATTPIPTEQILPLPEDLGFARLNYGLEAAAGTENEKVVGKILIFDPEDERSKWNQPTVTINEPADGASLAPGEIEIKATIESDYDEQWRVSWFASDGKIENRRSAVTKWESPGSGEHTLILTVRGLNSNTFVIKTSKVSLQ